MSVVYTEAFTVASDTNLGAFGDWTQIGGSAGDLLVDADNDRVEQVVSDALSHAYWNGSGAPTGDQKVSVDIRFVGGATNCYAWPAARVATGGGVTLYALEAQLGENQIQIRRYLSGTASTLAFAAHTFDADTTYKLTLEVIGTGATVALVGYVDDVEEVNFDDTDANRITSGVPGLGGFTTSDTLVVTFDNFVVDDLAASSALPLVNAMMLT